MGLCITNLTPSKRASPISGGSGGPPRNPEDVRFGKRPRCLQPNSYVKFKYSKAKDKLALTFKGLNITSLAQLQKELFPNPGMHTLSSSAIINDAEDAVLECLGGLQPFPLSPFGPTVV